MVSEAQQNDTIEPPGDVHTCHGITGEGKKSITPCQRRVCVKIFAMMLSFSGALLLLRSIRLHRTLGLSMPLPVVSRLGRHEIQLGRAVGGRWVEGCGQASTADADGHCVSGHHCTLTRMYMAATLRWSQMFGGNNYEKGAAGRRVAGGWLGWSKESSITEGFRETRKILHPVAVTVT